MLIKGAQVFDGYELSRLDILVREGKIEQVAPNILPAGHEVLEAEGCVVSPGFTDLHVHLREPGFEGKETIATGTAAAAAGGFTTVCSMPNLSPVPDNLHNLQPQLEAIEKDALIRVLPYGAATVGEKGDCIADIEVLAPFVCGFSDDGRGVQKSEMMRRVLQKAALSNSFVAAHCEDEGLIDAGAVTVQQNSSFAMQNGYTGVSSESEAAEVERDILLAKETNAHLHICHTSALRSFQLIRQAKQEGVHVTCEVTPHNLLLCCDDITQNDGRFKMNPPLRTREEQQAALQALLDGTADAIATDHAPHTPREKAGGFSAALNGVVGLETAFASLYTKLVKQGSLTLEKLLYLLTTGPRKVLGENPHPIAAGQMADLVVLDLQTQRTVEPQTFYTKGRSTPFEGWDLYGWPILTLSNGKVVYDKNKR